MDVIFKFPTLDSAYKFLKFIEEYPDITADAIDEDFYYEYSMEVDTASGVVTFVKQELDNDVQVQIDFCLL